MAGGSQAARRARARRNRRAAPKGYFAFEVDSKTGGTGAKAFVKKMSGGELVGKTAKHDSGVEKLQLQTLCGTECKEITVEIGMGASQDLFDWINEAMEPGLDTPRYDGVMTWLDYGHNVTWQRRFEGAIITEVSLPALDGKSAENAYITVKMMPEHIPYEGRTASSDYQKTNRPEGQQQLITPGRWTINIGNDSELSEGVGKIGAVSWKQTVTQHAVGGGWVGYELVPTKYEISDVKVTVGNQWRDVWHKWYQGFVVEGQCGSGHYQKADLQFLSQDGGQVLANVELRNLGIKSLVDGACEANADGVQEFDGELFCEGVHLTASAGITS